MLHFLLTFIILLLVSSFFICAIHYLTRHTIEVQPDNKIKVRGYIGKQWSMFWEKQTGTKIIYYSGDSLKHKHNFLEKTFPSIAHKFHLSIEDKSFVLNKTETLSKQEKDNFEKLIGCQYEINADAYFLFIEEPVYLFPEWVRNPLCSCVICMSSIYGSIIWITINNLSHNLFSWTNHKTLGFFLFWFVFIVLLSQINGIVYRKTVEYVL